MKTARVIGFVACVSTLIGCTGPKVSQQSMQDKTAALKKIAVASILDQRITIHDIALPIGPAASSSDVASYDINETVEKALSGRLAANGRFEASVQPEFRQRLRALNHASYPAYPNYNPKLKPFLTELKAAGVDALLVVSPFDHITFKDAPNPLAPGSGSPVEGYGLYYGPKNLRAVYVTATVSLYVTDDPTQEKMYYIRPRLFKDAKLANVPYAKGILKGGPKFNDYSADEQTKYLSELDKVIQEELVKNLSALGL
jgi:hypothetical protein